MSLVKPLSIEHLYRTCDPKIFPFETTDELENQQEIIGQPRAVHAIQFGIGIKQNGFNIFALGPEGVGKQSIVRRFFLAQAQQDPVPSDWCYVHNFEQTHRPNAIELPGGMGIQFCESMQNLVEELQTAIASAFESDEYRTRRQGIEEEFKDQQEEVFEGVQRQAAQHNLMVLRTPAGLMFAPTRDGQVIPPEEVQKLSSEERARVETDIEKLQEVLQEALERVPDWQKELRSRLRSLNREMTEVAVQGLIAAVRKKFNDFDEIRSYLDAVQADVVENARDFLADEDEGQPGSLAAAMQRGARRAEGGIFRNYEVNLVIDHSNSTSAPVIYEDNPAYQNLIGRVEQIARMGALVTDFTLIKPGSLLKANGGYLMLDARKVLTHPYAWEGLKRALLSSQVKIESPSQMMNLISTITIEPEPIPLNVKVALIGDRFLYYLLARQDPDFNELFKVAADFEEEMDRSPETVTEYAQLIAALVRRYRLKPHHRDAVARVVEFSSRFIGDSEKLSVMMNSIADLLQEANYWATEGGAEIVRAAHIQQAIEAQLFRANRLKERMQETIVRETILIDTQGARVGQINALSVLQLGSFAFGRPSRITARVRLGKGEVIDIEREVELGGPLHSKGVLILSSFLGSRYAPDHPLSLAASLVFEQSYGGVDGDSASSAELYALLSAIAEAPIRQSLAVTGSVNQHGEVQAIGGVNEKIEGFFELCKARGLSGDQGVLIPHANVKHLMLREDVLAAVASGQFQIYPVKTIDEGIEMLTGILAGTADEAGNFPPDSLNGRVQTRLVELARKGEEKQENNQ